MFSFILICHFGLVSEIGALSDSLEVEPVDVAPLDTGRCAFLIAKCVTLMSELF